MRIYIKHNKFKFVLIFPLIAIKSSFMHSILSSEQEDEKAKLSKEEYREEKEKLKKVSKEMYKELKTFRKTHGKFTLLYVQTKDTNVKIVI